MPKNQELDELLAEESSLSDVIYEAHPELVFRLMAEVQLPKKKLPEGLTARLGLLERAGVPATQLISDLMNQYPRSVCFADDGVDALILLLLAHSSIEDLDQEPEVDRQGIPINLKIPCVGRPAIVYFVAAAVLKDYSKDSRLCELMGQRQPSGH